MKTLYSSVHQCALNSNINIQEALVYNWNLGGAANFGEHCLVTSVVLALVYHLSSLSMMARLYGFEVALTSNDVNVKGVNSSTSAARKLEKRPAEYLTESAFSRPELRIELSLWRNMGLEDRYVSIGV